MNINKATIIRMYKNQYLFEKRIWSDLDFVTKVRQYMLKYNPHSFPNLAFNSPLMDGTNDEHREAFSTRMEKFRVSQETARALPQDLRSEFFHDVLGLAQGSGLGNEWLSTLVSLIIDHWFFPPIHNLNIKPDEGKKRVVLELNPDTSIDDIMVAWEEIQHYQKKLYPGFKKVNFTKKSFKHLNIHKKSLVAKTKKNSDMYIVADIWADAEDNKPETDKKRRSNLRQIRHRMKDV